MPHRRLTSTPPLRQRSARLRPARWVLVRLLCALTASGLLAACAAGPAPQGDSLAKATAEDQPSRRVAIAPVKPQEPAREQSPPRQARQAPPAPQIDPAHIVGLEPAALLRLLGKPWLKRDERPAQVWLYASGACAFHIFLYADPQSGHYVVRYFDAVPRDGIPVSRHGCFNALLRRQGPQVDAGA